MPRTRGRGEGTVRQRGDGRWEARVDLGWVDERRKRHYLYGRTREEVTAKLRQAQAQADRGLPLGDARTTVGAWLDR